MGLLLWELDNGDMEFLNIHLIVMNCDALVKSSLLIHHLSFGIAGPGTGS
jgi:hypothetical protein